MKEIIINNYLQGESVNFLSKKFGLSYIKVMNTLLDNNIIIRDREEASRIAKEKHIILSSDILERIEGELLGDANMYSSKYQASLRFSSKHRDYMEWICALLKENDIKLAKGEVNEYSNYDKRTNKIYTNFSIRTKGFVELKEIYEKWYKDKIKIIPNDIILTKNHLLHWWLGDGFISTRCGFFCTDGFSEAEVIKLSNLINDTFDLNSKSYPRKNPSGKIAFRIYLPQKTLIKMLEIIGNPPIKSLSYRWEIKS